MKAPASAPGLMMDEEEQLRKGKKGGGRSRLELKVKDNLASCKFFTAVQTQRHWGCG